MTISAIRTLLYALAALLGDASAIRRSIRTGSPKPIAVRVARRETGAATGRALGDLFRPYER